MKFLKNLLFYLVTICITIGCTKKSVKLPLLSEPGIQEIIYDNTQIWMFYNEETPTPSLKLNKHNKISGTHWIFNIDKRLPMSLVVPELKKLLDKRKKPGMHSSDKVLSNYFSYVDSVQGSLSMVKFNSINYTSSTNEIYQSSDPMEQIKNLKIDASNYYINDSLINPSHLTDYLNNTTLTSVQLRLSFNEHIHYSRYLRIKATLANMINDRIHISETEQMITD